MKYIRFAALLLAAGMILPFAAGCNETPSVPEGQLPEWQQPEQNPEKDPAQKPEEQQPEQKPEQKPEEPPKKDEYTLSLGARYFLATAEGAETVRPAAVLECNGEPAEGEISYAVADEEIARCSDGQLTAVGAGTTRLTASFLTPAGETLTATARVDVLSPTTAEKVNSFDEEGLNLLGRTYLRARKLQLDNVCTGVEIAFYGTELTATFSSCSGMLVTFFDGGTEGTNHRILKTRTVKLAEGLPLGVHVVRAVKGSNPEFNNLQFESTNAFVTDGFFLKPPAKPDFEIEFIGDSITEGYGATGKSGESTHTPENSVATASYAYLTAQALDADYSIIALAGICVKDGAENMYDRYTKKGFSVETEYEFNDDPDVVVLALGENDMWHATSDQFPDYNVTLFEQDYAQMLRLIREKRPRAKIVCIYGMMPASAKAQTGAIVTAAIAATGDDNITQIKMVSNASGACSHPSAAAHRATAETLTAHIRSLFE